MKIEEVRWPTEFPADVRVLVEPFLRARASMVPCWVQELKMEFDPEDNQNTAFCRLNYPNRWATLGVTAYFLNAPPEMRDRALLHEIAHMQIEPLYQAVRGAYDVVGVYGTPTRVLLERTVQDGLESAVEDMAYCWQKCSEEIVTRMSLT